MTRLLLFDVGPPLDGSVIGIALAMLFFFLFSVAAFIAYKILKRTVKMAFRMIIVSLIMLIAVIGSIALYFSIDSKPVPKKPAGVKTTR